MPERPMLTALAAAGVSRCLLAMRNDDPAGTLARLDEWAPLSQAN